jgi:ABC-type transport system involved in cytochrome c biogenesis ATPase subunit
MTIELRNVSRWYGNVVAVNDITMTIGPGVTGLLGPNGAGKSTIMHMIAGFLPPSRGELTIGSGSAGSTSAWRHPAVYRQVGLVPERDSVYAFLTGSQFVMSTAKLHELPDPGAAAARAIDMLDMAEAADRKIATYSKGMRQRIKVAIVRHHPGGGGRSPGRLWRLPRDPAADDEQAARVHGALVRRPHARRHPDRPARRDRRGTDQKRPAGADLGLRRVLP